MRSNQVEIKVRRFGDQVPESYGNNIQVISVYADSNNLYEALAVANSELMKALQEFENIPSFGTTTVSNNNVNPRLV